VVRLCRLYHVPNRASEGSVSYRNFDHLGSGLLVFFGRGLQPGIPLLDYGRLKHVRVI
jgi:hypothetical protein